MPRPINVSGRVYLAMAGLVVLVWVVGFTVEPFSTWIDRGDVAVLRWVAGLRHDALTTVMLGLHALGSEWVVRTIRLATVVALLGLRRFRHLLVLLGIILVVNTVASTISVNIGRPRPVGVEILGSWDGYSHPSQPVMSLGLSLMGVLYTLVPAGTLRNRAKWVAGVPMVALGAARLYLAVDYPTDVFVAVVLGMAVPVLAFRLLIPNEIFPVTYRRSRAAHLDVGGRRGEAIAEALQHQLGLTVTEITPFRLEGSAGSTPLRLRVSRGPDQPDVFFFGKLYAFNHLRSDRWYKLGRLIRYGRLEDESGFSSVRRLVEYEDYLLRVMRDAGLPVAEPYGFVEITPEREYLIVTEFFDGATEIDVAEVDDEVIDDGLAVVRRMWDVGLAHRDIKPANVLVRDGNVLLIDVAFASVRPTPWRQAVDLANMMLTLALYSTAERVYERALLVFAPDEIAEAFAASRSVTVPSQLRARLRSDGRDLAGRFRHLAPERPPISIRLWSLRRIGVTLGVAAVGLGALVLVAINLRTAGLL
ncbi:MAG: phosphatase PAP2 family protein [Actinomycetota bacterium]|nr:phosphatase PAP2 family protein [Actinomycetota bacterium]